MNIIESLGYFTFLNNLSIIKFENIMMVINTINPNSKEWLASYSNNKLG